MPCPKRTTSTIERRGAVIDLARHPLSHGHGVESSLRCVSSGYMSSGCSCTRTVPESLVAAAWAAAQQSRRAGESGFFEFPGRGEIWLGFGVAEGEPRGVYCPQHRAEREARFAGCEAQHYAPAVAAGA